MQVKYYMVSSKGSQEGRVKGIYSTQNKAKNHKKLLVRNWIHECAMVNYVCSMEDVKLVLSSYTITPIYIDYPMDILIFAE